MASKERLADTLHSRHITMIALGGVVGAGFFIGSSSAILKAGPAVFLSYVLVGVLIYLINLSLRDLILKGPGRGSFMFQIRAVLGARLGFLAGWGYWLTWVTVLAAEVMAGAAMLHPYVPLPFTVLEILLLALMTGVNLLSVRGYGEAEFWLSLIKILAIVVFIAIGIWVLARGWLGWGPHVPVWHNLTGFGGLVPCGWMAVLAVVPTIVFSMTGSEIVTVAALESGDPDGNIQRIMRTLAIRLAVVYLASIAVILCLRPWSHMTPTESPFLLVLNQIGLPFAGAFVWVVIFSAVLSTLNSSMYVTSRILYELAEDGDAPEYFLKVDARRKMPSRAVMAGFAGALGVVLLSSAGAGKMFALLLSLTGTLMLFNNFLIILARMKIVPEGQAAPRLACFLLACTLGAMLWVPETRSQVGLGVLAILVISCAAWYRYRSVPELS